MDGGAGVSLSGTELNEQAPSGAPIPESGLQDGWHCPRCDAIVSPSVTEHCKPAPPPETPAVEPEITRDHMGAIVGLAPGPVKERRHIKVRLGFDGGAE